MPTSQQLGGPRRSWKPLEKDLRKLHRRGLREPLLDDLTVLTTVARRLSDETSDRDAVEAALALAIDSCWGNLREVVPTLRDVMRIWFGLPAVDDPDAPTLYGQGSAERHRLAWQYWQGADRGEAADTFRTSKATVRYEAIARKMVELERDLDGALQPGPSEPAPMGAQDNQAPTQVAKSLGGHAGVTPTRTLLGTRGRRASAALAATIAAAALLFWQPWASGGSAIPPFGAVVNAQTGDWTMTAPKTPVEFATGQIAGGNNYAVCDLTAEGHACRYRRKVLRPGVGDLLEFSVRLNNGFTAAIPYVHLQANTDYSPGPPPVAKDLSRELYAFISVEYPTIGELGSGTVKNFRPETNQIAIQMPTWGHYVLNYVPGSSSIAFKPTHFFHRLPDGIMDSGIALQDVGEPQNCHLCDLKYIRFVNFKARLVRGASDSRG